MNICQQCIYHEDFYRWRVRCTAHPMCTLYTTTKINPVSGNRVVDQLVLCCEHNKDGRCTGFMPQPQKQKQLGWAQRWAIAIDRALKEVGK